MFVLWVFTFLKRESSIKKGWLEVIFNFKGEKTTLSQSRATHATSFLDSRTAMVVT